MQGQKRTASVCPKRLIQLSTVGEVFLEGTCSLSRRPQTAKSPCPCFRAHGERDKKRQLFAGGTDVLRNHRNRHKNHRAGTKTHCIRVPEKADPTEHSWRGVLRGHVPSKSPSADGEMLRAHASGHTEKVGEKSDSFSRAERTRPLRPVSRLQHCDLGNVPVERFQRNFPCYKNTGHGTICP